ncbi:competence protein CoiA [Pseudomonas corrugata]|uniref:competence protein CoiA n=1 Tax=Pseudomonas corrugata TaxID=47879 RepID=UPI00222F4B40|nr:competence protein CoiA [Pseudomonas corrugata]UZD97639.1 competence protein CoiA [Pseudomonas corrugata]
MGKPEGQSQANPFAFKMPCCQSRAVLKTSSNGLPFFSHLYNECATAPETIWHIEGKDLVFGALKFFGVNPQSEVPGGTGKDQWKADIYFEIGERKVAIELQRSYQHLRAFIRRQERYARYRVECYWLVRHSVGTTLGDAIIKKRWKEEFGSKYPPEGHVLNTWSTFYWGVLIPGDDPTIVTPGQPLSHLELLANIVNNDLHWDGMKWSMGRTTPA